MFYKFMEWFVLFLLGLGVVGVIGILCFGLFQAANWLILPTHTDDDSNAFGFTFGELVVPRTQKVKNWWYRLFAKRYKYKEADPGGIALSSIDHPVERQE